MEGVVSGMSKHKNYAVLRQIDVTNHTIGDCKLQNTAPVDVSCVILISKSDKISMINKCIKKRKELLDA
tara:strand:- start:284 stop:490 length:207 start_codon:yes stop_codon:yes gene_type:complete